MKRIIVGLSGASGVGMGLELLRTLREVGCETHLVMTDAARRTCLSKNSAPFPIITIF